MREARHPKDREWLDGTKEDYLLVWTKDIRDSVSDVWKYYAMFSFHKSLFVHAALGVEEAFWIVPIYYIK